MQDQAHDATGHGKSKSDGYGGFEKNDAKDELIKQESEIDIHDTGIGPAQASAQAIVQEWKKKQVTHPAIMSNCQHMQAWPLLAGDHTC